MGLWSHHLIENTVQGNHLSRPAFHRFDDGRLLVYFADNRYTQTHMMRAERPKGGTDWTVKRVAEDYGPGYQIGFAGPADDPTRELLFTITGKQSLALAKAEQLDDEKVFLEKSVRWLYGGTPRAARHSGKRRPNGSKRFGSAALPDTSRPTQRKAAAFPHRYAHGNDAP